MNAEGTLSITYHTGPTLRGRRECLVCEEGVYTLSSLGLLHFAGVAVNLGYLKGNSYPLPIRN